MRLRWESGEPDEAARRLAAVVGPAQPVAAGGGAADAGPAASQRVAHDPAEFRLRNAVIEVSATGARDATADRLIVIDERPDGRAAATGTVGTAAVTLVGIGIATVDIERFAAERDWRMAAAMDDTLLGATAAVTSGAKEDMPAATPSIVLLEPNTEGRIAASLARHGEGPAVVYLWPESGIDDARAEVGRRGYRPTPIATGPFGRAFAIGGGAWGPHLVVVESGVLCDPARIRAP